MCHPLLWAALSSQAVDIDREVNNICAMNKDRLKQKDYKIQTGSQKYKENTGRLMYFDLNDLFLLCEHQCH